MGYNQRRQNTPQVRASRQAAHAPYNFIPLPDQAVPSDALVRHTRYYPKRFAGRFMVKLTTVTPLYVRGMVTVGEILKHEQTQAENKDKRKLETPDFFNVKGNIRIPGSSLRGMLRTLVEIITFSKIQPISDRQGFFFRAVAAKGDDPLRDPYRDVIGSFSKNVRAGYLYQEGDKWYVQPAQRFGTEAFAKVKDKLRNGTSPVATVHGLKRFSHPEYTVQYHDIDYVQERDMILRVTNPKNAGAPMGVLVCTGNMAETQGKESVRSPRTTYAIVLPRNESAARLPIPEVVVSDYVTALTPFQKESELDPERGVLINGRPVFYIEENGEVIRFGHTPNFRIAHLVRDAAGLLHAVTTHNQIPDAVLKIADDGTDYAEAMFGYVQDANQQEGSAYASRISVTSAALVSDPANALESAVITPKILGAPKPTTFQHYLEQPKGVQTPKPELHHWGTKNARIRGHKLYWRKHIRGIDEVREKEVVKGNDTQHTMIRPVKAGVEFRFQVYFENLSEIELGALAWALTLDGDPNACHMLGMGKPYGMGVIRLEAQMVLSQRISRYESLFDEAGDWSTGDVPADTYEFIVAFKQMIVAKTGRAFDAHERIKELKTLLGLVKPGKSFDYMTIEPNEFKDRPVLPHPSDVLQR